MITKDVPVFHLDGSPMGQKVVAGALGTVAAPVRHDGFVVVKFPYYDGVMALLNSKALEQRE